MAVPARERREAIVAMAQTSGLMSVEELSDHFAVTASTIRRDLSRLEQDGLLTRTYGGVRAIHSHAESTLRQRLGEAYAAKQAIARRAREEVGAGESVMLDAGTTVAALAHELKDADDLHAVVAGVTSLIELAESPFDVDVLGGRVRAISQGFIGGLAESALERMTFDRAFLGADGVDAELGINEAELAQTRLKELMAARAHRVYVLAHHEKLGSRSFHAWARLPLPWTLITDARADASRLDAFERAGVRVIVAEA